MGLVMSKRKIPKLIMEIAFHIFEQHSRILEFIGCPTTTDIEFYLVGQSIFEQSVIKNVFMIIISSINFQQI